MSSLTLCCLLAFCFMLGVDAAAPGVSAECEKCLNVANQLKTRSGVTTIVLLASVFACVAMACGLLYFLSTAMGRAVDDLESSAIQVCEITLLLDPTNSTQDFPFLNLSH